jgi:putative nucleotidyltransferase with HDIG domain
LVNFTNIITPAYIIVLLLLIILEGSNNAKVTNELGVVLSIIGIVLSIFGMGNLAILISGVVIITYAIYQKLLVNNQHKYDKKVGIDAINSKEYTEKEVTVKKETIAVSKYDIDRIKEAFDNFVSDYDMTNEMIDAKYKHTIFVAENSLNIAKSIGLDEEGRFLAYLIGILHDIGRFEQAKKYNSYEDASTVDHADYGYDLLKEGLIRQFIHENKYDDIILKAVKNHNKVKIDDNFTDDEKLYCSIIRDADKLDIFKRSSEGTYKDDYNVTKDMVISPEVISEINKKHTISFDLVNNKLDQVVLRLAMVYDINYNYALKFIKQNDYLNKYIILLNTLDSNKIALKKMVDEIYAYIDSRIK